MYGVCLRRAVGAAFVLLLVGAGVVTLQTPAGAATTNPIVIENEKPGTSAFGLAKPADDVNKQVKGYASATSANLGETVDFKVTVTPAQTFVIAFFRLGYYQGFGARLVQSVGPINGVSQGGCPIDGTTGLIECNWSTSYSLTVPTTWTSGVYLARLTNAAGYSNYVPFVVRDDARATDILYQASFSTYQAYNAYPSDNSGGCGSTRPASGKSLYDNKSSNAPTVVGNRAAKVSFDRPYACAGAGDLSGTGWTWEPQFISWMERSGYDVSYSTDIDTAVNGNRLLAHKTWISAGHDEYWTREQYDAVASARDAGVNVAFLGGNSVYWQVRYEPSSSGAANRVMVSYKNTPNNSYLTKDPISDPTQATVRFQDPPLNRPGQLLTGMSTSASTGRSTMNTPLRPTATGNWVFGNSGLIDGSSVAGITGYETDAYNCHYQRPANTTYAVLAASPMLDSDGYTQAANATIYRAPSGAWVFNAGTMSWSWALVNQSDPAQPGSSLYDSRLDAITRNVFDAFVGRTTQTDFPSNVPLCTYKKRMTFEDGSVVSQTTGANRKIGTVSLETANPIAGAASAKISNAPGSWLEDLVTPADDLNLEFSLRLDSQPTVDVRVAAIGSLLADSVGNLVLTRGTDGLTRLQLRHGSSRVGFNSPPLAIGTTYRIGLHQRRGTGNNGVLEGVVAPTDSSFGAPFAATTSAPNTTRADRVRVGSTTNNASTPPLLNATIDDVIIDGAPGDARSSPPAAPTALTATATAPAQVDLRWNDNATDETSYEVSRSTNGGSTWTSLTAELPSNTTSYTDTTTTPNTTYSYVVIARNANGFSPPSNAASATTPGSSPVAPAAPTNLRATQVTSTRVDLAWNDNAANETAYVLERAGESSFANASTITLSANATSTSDNLPAAGAVWYRIRAFSGTTPSPYSNAITVTATSTGSRVKEMTFEGGSLSGPSGASTVVTATTVVLNSSTPLNGAYSASIPAGSSAAYLEQSVASNEIFSSFLLRLDAPPTQDVRVAQLLHGTGGAAVTGLTIWVRANGTVQLKNYNTTIANGPSLSVGTTYRIGLHEKMLSGGLLQLEGFVVPASQPFTTPFGSTSSATSAATLGIAIVRIGSTLGSGGLAASLDDVKIDTAIMP